VPTDVRVPHAVSPLAVEAAAAVRPNELSALGSFAVVVAAAKFEQSAAVMT